MKTGISVVYFVGSFFPLWEETFGLILLNLI